VIIEKVTKGPVIIEIHSSKIQPDAKMQIERVSLGESEENVIDFDSRG